MFYIATAFLEGQGLAYSKHSAVIAAFGERFARPQRVPREFHRYLIDAERTRLRGDYNTDPNITQADADQIIQRTSEILNFAKVNIDSLSP